MERQGTGTVTSTRPTGADFGADPGRFANLWAALIRVHDFCFSDKNKSILKRLVVKISIAGFSLHLALIFLSHMLGRPPLLASVVGDSYLSAISTPFSCILFYEVVTLIAAMPASTTRSIANQFEIVSLIFLRDVFKDIAKAHEPNWIQGNPHLALPFLFDMIAGLFMFFLTTVFRQVAQRQVRMPATPALVAGQNKFIAQKKVVAVGLTALLLSLAIYHLGGFVAQLWTAASTTQLLAVEAIELLL